MRWGWFVFPIVVLACGALLIYLAALGRPWIPYVTGGAIALLWLAWVLASALSPARPKLCPRCGEDGLRRLRRGDPLGIRCKKCGHEDASAHVPHLE